MEIFILRHGESFGNAEKRFPKPDKVERGLNERGKEQARNAADYLSGKGIEIIYSSPIGRALHTSRIISDRITAPIVVVDSLKDTDFGALSGLKEDGSDADDEKRKMIMERRKEKTSYKAHGGENAEDVAKRVTPPAESILKCGKNRIAIVAHLYPNRVIIGRILNLSLKDSWNILQPNDLIYFSDTETRRIGYFWNGSLKEGLLLKDA